MVKVKHEYFQKGSDNQKRPNIVMDLRRPTAEKMQKWTDQEKEYLHNFIATCESVFGVFIKQLKKQINAGK
mgnify:CR=1 FL=1